MQLALCYHIYFTPEKLSLRVFLPLINRFINYYIFFHHNKTGKTFLISKQKEMILKLNLEKL